jgi:hypothetical protein
MGATEKYFSQFTFREYLAWTSEEDSDDFEFIELDQFAASIFNNFNIPWNADIKLIVAYLQQHPDQFDENAEELLLELYEEYQTMIDDPDEDELYVIETHLGEIVSVYTRDD